MSSHQRKRGLRATIYRSKDNEDRRGNQQRTWTSVNPHLNVKVVLIADRSAKAEVPGQQEINVTKILTPADLEDVDLYSRVVLNGVTWDVVAPPALHTGTKHTRHWSLTLRRRPA